MISIALLLSVVKSRPTEREGGEQGILPWGPQTFRGNHEAFIFMTFSYLFVLHLHTVSFLLLPIALSGLNE